jgi:hypothetical protein
MHELRATPVFLFVSSAPGYAELRNENLLGSCAFSENTGVTREFELKMHIRNAEVHIIMQPPESE